MGRLHPWLGRGLLTAANIGLLALVYFTLGTPPAPRSSPAPAPVGNVPTPTPIAFVRIVIAVQNIPRGTIISPGMVDYTLWPEDFTPSNAMISIEDVIGKVARTDLYREGLILSSAISASLSELNEVGSEIAAMVPNGTVAKTIRLPRHALPIGLEAGDYVNVFYTYLEDGTINAIGTTGLLVDDARVLWIGELPLGGSIFQRPTPTPFFDEGNFRTTPVLTPTVSLDDEIPVVLVVTNQDAAKLIWSEYNQIPLSLVIRSVNDVARTIITPVGQGTIPR